MESQPQNPEFRNNPENFHPCEQVYLITPRKQVFLCRGPFNDHVCLFDLILYVPSTIFQLYRDRSSILS